MKKILSVLIVILISLIITSGISGIFAIVAMLAGWNPLAWFLGTFALQYVIGGMWNLFVRKMIDVKMKHIRVLNDLKDITKYINLPCSYCNIENTIPIIIGHDNKFNCKSCQGLNKIDINYSVIRTTEPIQDNDVIKKIFEHIDSNNKKITENSKSEPTQSV
jgi:hypothetical protein